MDNLDCNGTESSLDQCPFPGWYVEDCSHGEDVGVDCFGGMSSSPPPTTPSTIPSEPGKECLRFI